MLRFCAGKLIVCAQRTSSVHCRWSTTHVDGESNRLGNLLTRSPVLMGHLRVVGDAAVAVDRDADRERHQLLRFRIDAFGGRRRCRKSSKGFLDALRGETKIFYGHPHAFIFFPQVLQMANYALSLIARSCGSTCSPQNFVCAATCPGTADLLFQQPHCWVRREENILSVPSANPPDLQIHQNRKISVAGIPPKSTIAQAASCI
jgi:hypothetical protein